MNNPKRETHYPLTDVIIDKHKSDTKINEYGSMILIKTPSNIIRGPDVKVKFTKHAVLRKIPSLDLD